MLRFTLLRLWLKFSVVIQLTQENGRHAHNYSHSAHYTLPFINELYHFCHPNQHRNSDRFYTINGKKAALSGVRQTSKFTLWRKSENKSLRLSLLSTYQLFKVLRKSTILSLLCSRTFHPITVRYSVVRPLFELFKQRNY